MTSIKFELPSITTPEIKDPLSGTILVASRTIGGGTISTPKIPEIPALANGGIVSSPTLAMIGEAGKEAVIPLSGNFINQLAGAIGTVMLQTMQFGQTSQASGTNEITLNIDGTQFMRAIMPAMKREQSRIGNSTIIQGI
jgi:hypothetical protein